MHDTPFLQLTEALTPMYGAGEARSIARIVIEDGFGVKAYSSFLCKTEAETAKLAAITAQLLEGAPVQYVLGVADFFGLQFVVTPEVLIPRQETEELVDVILTHIKGKYEHCRILDIGLGSGCIAVTLKNRRPDIQIFGFEKSEGALSIAQLNADQILGPGGVQFVLTDILTKVPNPGEQYEIIVSNPPYIPRYEAAIMPRHVLEYEPDLALFVEDDDPLIFYKVIVKYAWATLVAGGALFFECNEFNTGEVATVLQSEGFQQVELRKDLSGAERIVSGIKP